MHKQAYLIWYIGSVVWWIDAAVNLHYGARAHAAIALSVAVAFFSAGVFLSRSAKPK